jgi:thiol-disulfide isomerase/thioredoxin
MTRTNVGIATIVLVVLISTSVGLTAESKTPNAAKLPDKARQLEFASIAGAKVRPLDVQEGKPSVVVFVLHDCPISNKYAPELQRLADEFGKRGARFYVVHVDAELSDRDASKHAEEYQYKLPVLVDRKHDLVRTLGATTAPEAFIIGSDSKVQYRGRIDDRFVALGKPRHEVRERDLRRALEAVIERRQVEVAETKPVGCLIPELE